MGTTDIWHFTPETWHYTQKADLSVLQIGGMPTLEIFAAVFGVSAMALGWAFDLQGGHFGSLGWAFSGASYYWLKLKVIMISEEGPFEYQRSII